jgi:hypothetical protein
MIKKRKKKRRVNNMTSDKKFLEELASMMETSSRANWGNDIDWQQELKWFRNEILEHLRRKRWRHIYK